MASSMHAIDNPEHVYVSAPAEEEGVETAETTRVEYSITLSAISSSRLRDKLSDNTRTGTMFCGRRCRNSSQRRGLSDSGVWSPKNWRICHSICKGRLSPNPSTVTSCFRQLCSKGVLRLRIAVSARSSTTSAGNKDTACRYWEAGMVIRLQLK